MSQPLEVSLETSEQSGGHLGVAFHRPIRATPVLALTSVKQPLPWSPVAESTRSRSISLRYPSLSSWTRTHMVKENNVGDDVGLSHRMAKENKSHSW